MKTIDSLLSSSGMHLPDKIVIADPETGSVSFSMLQEYAGNTSLFLRKMGVARKDRVAIVMNQGSDLAVAFLSVAAHCVATPLNPKGTRSDFRSWLSDLEAVCIIAGNDPGDQLIDTASDMGISVIAWDEIAGYQEEIPEPNRQPADPDDLALILHTSGTTAKAKMVPLTHANLMHSARNVSTVLRLDETDIGLCIMPLFHIHGIVACLLAPLFAGGMVIVPRVFEPEGLFTILREQGPTWFSAVPTMHQHIITHAETFSESRPVHSLRFIRSSSAMLPPVVMDRLESLFGVPVIEAYGMTEAAHQMCSNPLPPAKRKTGSVGIMAGPEVAVVDESGSFLSPGVNGEIVIRGENVSSGYLHLPDEMQGRLSGGWFRTGDMGRFDEEGYLYIVGRMKEIINRGGEKVSPLEVEEALLGIEEVSEAVSFGVAHQTLGEDLVAAVVLRQGSTIREQDIRGRLMEMLTHFKVPSRILILDSIPKSSIGKVQRLKMPDMLADRLAMNFVEPVNDTERTVAEVFSSVIHVKGKVGRFDNFFALGGDSLQATRAAFILQEKFNLEMPATLIFRYPSPESFAGYIDRERQRLSEELMELLKGRTNDEIDALLNDL
jgi:acyl-CoA synthetase (AMP-forming)/AMP-acid ligase II/acyl carrier protein